MAAKQIVDALLHRFLPLASRRIDTAQAQDGQYLRASDPAYEQVLDSLAMAAQYTPLALLEALTKWRDSESPKGANDASTFQRKLAVECIFCSACIRLVECCPHEGLPEASWKQLESFVFDWLINADRVVSQAEYPSLVDLRGLLLDLVAQLLGALSIIRFSSVTERFFLELNTRRNESNVARSEALSIIHGMRYLKLGVTTAGGLGASTSFVGKANPLLRTPMKKKTELHHALCNMLSNILAPLADAGKGHWPPKGVDTTLALWYESVYRIRNGLLQWMERQSKHFIVGYPLVTLLLCLGDPQSFQDQFESHLEHLYKHLREKNLRSMALDCLHRVVRFYLNVYSEKQPRNQVWDYLHSVTSQLLALLKKGGSLMQDVHQDKLVEFCLTIAERNLDFAMNHMILELLRTEFLSEAKVIGLRSLLAVVSSPSHRRAGSVDFRGEESHLAVSSSLRGSSFISWSSSAGGSPSNPHSGRVLAGTGFSDGAHDISHYMPKVRECLDHIIRTCHSAYGAARLTSSKSTLEPKSQGWPVFKWALKCIPSLLPDIWKNDRMTEILPSYGISIEPGVREEAVQVLFRTVHDQPQSRSAVMKGMANFILQLPDEYPLLIHTSLGRLVQLLQAWRACLAEESQYVGTRSFSSRDNGDHSYKSPFRHSGDPSKFHPFGMDAIGLIFLCSVDVPTRLTALELLHCVRALQNEIRRYSLKDRGKRLQREDIEPTFVIDVFEEAGEDIVKHCYWEPGRWYDLRREWEVVPSDFTLQSMLESHDKGKWARCLSELVKHAALLCPEAVDAARLEVVQRLANMTPADLGGKGSQTQDFESKLEQWSNYTMFACSCPPENSDDGGTQAAKDLFHMIFPLLKSSSEAQTFAATQALGHVHPELLETMLSSRSTFLEESATEVESRSKWKDCSSGACERNWSSYSLIHTKIRNRLKTTQLEKLVYCRANLRLLRKLKTLVGPMQSQKPRRDDVRMHVANVFRIAAENIWPGLLSRKPVLCIHFAKFIEETVRHIASTFSTQPESFQELQPLRFCLASVIRSLAPELVKGNSERFDPRARKRLFDLLLAWCDDTVGPWAQDTVGDYRREIERYKSSQNARSKDSMERINLEREVSDQVEALQWVAMNAMAALLYGPCFDDSARKMSGRIISWINALFLDPSLRVFGHSPADSRAPLQSKFSAANNYENFRNAVANKDRLRGSQFRAQLAKTALFNLLQTNLDLFPACIDQCYSSDSSIADGYFSVLAEVYMRQELPRCEIQRLLSLILYKVVDPSRQIRDDALQMLETLSAREWAEEGEGVGSGRYRAAVVGNLPDSYQQFQYQLSAKLAREHPELSELLCEEIMQRQLDAVDIIAQHQVLTCMAPWIENLQLWKHSGWCERLLKSMYYVTWRHGDQFPDEIEQLWSTVAKKVKNISPVLDFLIAKGIEDCDSNATGEISGAFATYFSVAKRISLYLARVSPQQTIDNLVYELAQRMAEDQPEQQLKRSLDSVLDFESSNQVLEFSQGPMQMQVLDPPPPMSPLFVRSSLEGALRNVSGSLSWRTATGRSTSGPLNNMPLPEIHTGRSGQLFTASGPLPTLSGPLMGVRTSTGSIKSRHLSRDSGDYFVETPHSNEDMRSTTSAADMQAALQVHHHWLLKADIALILLAEIAYENDEDFRGHLPLLFHVTFVSMDSSEDIVLEHCQQLLVNLLYSLAGRPLESYSVGGDYGDAAYKQQVESLVKYVQSKKGRMMWENEDMSLTRIELPSATLLSALVQSVVDAIFFQGDLQERWGEEALKWAMECSSRHLAGRSHQIYRALHPPVTSDTCISLLRCLHRCFSNPSPAVLGFIMEILLTLQVIVENMEAEKVILYPQLFWACVAMLHTDFVHVYTQVLELFSRVIDRLSFRDQTVENVLLSNMPRDELEHEKDMSWVELKNFETERKSGGNEVVKAPMFEGVQPLVLKGVMSTVSHASAIEVLSRITVNSCDCIFGNSETRLLMHIIGMLPWLCLQLHKEHNIALSGSFESPLQQQYQKAYSVAANISHWCEAKDFNDLASIFYAYSEGNVTTMESLLDQVSPRICAQWFPRHSPLAFGHLLRLLEKGPVEYHRVILLLLRSLLQYTQMDPSQSPQVYAVITQFVESNLCREALKVLEALLQSCSNCGGQQEDRSEKAAVVTLVSQSSFKARSGPLHYSAGSGGAFSFSHGSTNMLPSRETALQNTRLTLDRVLDTYGPGKKRDYKRRLVPFVASSTQLNTGAQHLPQN